MLLHVGEDLSVRLDSVVAILDRRLFERAPVNAQFLRSARLEGRLEGRLGPEVESVILAGRRVVLSHLSRQTLTRRANLGLPAGVLRAREQAKKARRKRR